MDCGCCFGCLGPKNTHDNNFSFFPNTYPSQVRTEDVRRGVLAAMCVWEMNSKIRFNIELQNGNEDANIRIKFGESKLIFSIFALLGLKNLSTTFGKSKKCKPKELPSHLSAELGKPSRESATKDVKLFQ